MRWDSPIVLVSAGTAAIHVILLVFIDAMIVTNPLVVKPPAPRIEMFEIKIDPPPMIKPVAAPLVPVAPPEPVAPKEPSRPRPRAAPTPEVRTQPQPPQEQTTSSDSGGDPVVSMPDLGKPVVRMVDRDGPPSGRGRGGSGGGSGAGSGPGGADAPPPPVSVATIKTRAMPKGDYGYFDAGKEYPPAARQLGIEGPIRVKLVVDAKGKVTSATLLNKLGHGLDELALIRARKIEFDPAKDTDDKPVASVVVWTFNMTLPK